MKEIKIDAIKQSTLKLTDKTYYLLHNLASYKHEDNGFSFFIRKDYIKAHLSDINTDAKKDPTVLIKMKEEIALLNKLLSKMKHKILLIDNDNLI